MDAKSIILGDIEKCNPVPTSVQEFGNDILICMYTEEKSATQDQLTHTQSCTIASKDYTRKFDDHCYISIAP